MIKFLQLRFKFTKNLNLNCKNLIIQTRISGFTAAVRLKPLRYHSIY